MSNKQETPVRWLMDEYHNSGDLTWTDFDHALQMEFQKQQKYDEMLAMLEDLLESWEVGNFDNEQFVFVKHLIKEAKEL
jgi:hypothetical protein